MKVTRVLMVLTMAMVIVACGGRVAPLESPKIVNVPSGLSEEQVQEVIQDAMAARGWLIYGQRPGVIEAKLNLREHQVRSDIYYDPDRVSIEYVSSVNLRYRRRGAEERIHQNYNNWTDHLSNDIRIGLNHASNR